MTRRPRLAECWERRQWAPGRAATWRRVPAALARYPGGTVGPSRYAVRVVTRRHAKRREAPIA